VGGVALSVKPGAAVAVREMELSTVSPPDVPVSKIVYVPWQAEVLLAMNVSVLT